MRLSRRIDGVCFRRPIFGYHVRPPRAGVARANLREDVSQLSSGKSYQENISEETTSNVAELVDIDRTGELLIWIFSSIFGKAKQEVGV